MTYVSPGYIGSEKAHLPNDVMFRDINCVVIPKLPAIMASRNFLLKVYGPFLSNSFRQSYDSGLWTVLRRRSSRDGELEPNTGRTWDQFGRPIKFQERLGTSPQFGAPSRHQTPVRTRP
jgi:hypothetical protein